MRARLIAVVSVIALLIIAGRSWAATPQAQGGSYLPMIRNDPSPTATATVTSVATTTVPPPPPPSTRPPRPTPTRDPAICAAEYPTVCIPPPPPDLNCPDIPYRNFEVLPPDRHHFDSDNDGIGCEQS